MGVLRRRWGECLSLPGLQRLSEGSSGGAIRTEKRCEDGGEGMERAAMIGRVAETFDWRTNQNSLKKGRSGVETAGAGEGTRENDVRFMRVRETSPPAERE